jgi:hypothetical protein
MKKSVRPPMVEVRHSPVHGYGVFALRRIRKGTTIMEYLGDRVSHEEADARYENKDPDDNHTFLFTVDSKTVIDGGVGGNDARYINHGCEPNCESASQNKRIFVEALRTIQAGEELAYDYQIQRDPEDPPNVDEIFACRCGAENCRGSMLVPVKKPRKKKAAARSVKGSVKKSAKKTSSRTAKRDSRARSTAARVREPHAGKAGVGGGAGARRKRDVKRRGEKRAAARRRGR